MIWLFCCRLRLSIVLFLLLLPTDGFFSRSDFIIIVGMALCVNSINNSFVGFHSLLFSKIHFAVLGAVVVERGRLIRAYSPFTSNSRISISLVCVSCGCFLVVHCSLFTYKLLCVGQTLYRMPTSEPELHSHITTSDESMKMHCWQLIQQLTNQIECFNICETAWSRIMMMGPSTHCFS